MENLEGRPDAIAVEIPSGAPVAEVIAAIWPPGVGAGPPAQVVQAVERAGTREQTTRAVADARTAAEEQSAGRARDAGEDDAHVADASAVAD